MVTTFSDNRPAGYEIILFRFISKRKPDCLLSQSFCDQLQNKVSDLPVIQFLCTKMSDIWVLLLVTSVLFLTMCGRSLAGNHDDDDDNGEIMEMITAGLVALLLQSH